MNRGGITKGLLVATTLVTALTGPVASGNADERAVTEQILQNNPDDGTKTVIRDRLVQLIEAAEDTEIRIASYHFDDMEVADALVDALGRNVKVRILIDALDGPSADPHSLDKGTLAYRTFAEAVGDLPDSWIETCGDAIDDGTNKGTSCMGRHIMHNKFFLFGKTAGTSNVVVQTSANLNAHSGTDMWNTAYQVSDEWLYTQYGHYFDDLRAHAAPDNRDDDYYNTFRNKHGPVEHGKYAMYVSPRASGNTYLDVLNDVRCTGNSSGGTGGDHRTIVRVAALQMAGANGIAIAKRLWDLDNQGCYVDVVADEITHQEKRGAAKGPLEYLLAQPDALPPDRINYHGPEVREFSSGQCGVHQKNLLIDGYYDGKANRRVVFTGSHNLNNKSPRYNDETLLRIDDASIHDQLKAHFFRLRAGASITWQTSKFDVEPKRHPVFGC